MKLLAAILLALLLTSQHVLADDPPAGDADPPADETVPAEGEGEEAPPAEDENKEHRLRPKTDKEEEAYKKRVVREDPFLNAPPGPDAAELAFYHPTDWLRFEVSFDRATYIAQDSAGQMLGFLTIDAGSHSSDQKLLHVILDYPAPKKHVELWLEPKALRPRSVTKLAAPEREPAPPPDPKKTKKQKKRKGKQLVAEESELLEPSGDLVDGIGGKDAQNLTRVEYLFDRVTIEREAGIVTTQERMRQLPYSYDIEQLPLLVRQLDFAKLAKHWPFEALITDPEHRRSLPLQIAEPKEVSITSAEPQKRACYELKMRLGERDNWTWWIERSAPYRLVKFSDGNVTYTLHQYDAAPGSY